MSVFAILECLEAVGVITDSQMNEMKKIAGKLPSTVADLLAIIASASLSNSNDAPNPFLGESVESEAASSTGATNIHSLAAIPEGATMALITVSGNNIIYRIDGEDPVANESRIAVKDSSFKVMNLSKFKFASQSGTSYIFVEYY